jgi:hypothetical protein
MHTCASVSKGKLTESIISRAKAELVLGGILILTKKVLAYV